MSDLASLDLIDKNLALHEEYPLGDLGSGQDFTTLGPAVCKGSFIPEVSNVDAIIAPEVLSGKQYTKESDVYSLGIIIYEVINGLPPYHDMAHEEFLAIKICHGLRPNFNIKVPQLIVDIFQQCVDAVPSKRPTVSYLHEKFDQWLSDFNNKD
ncbi:kinase-like domain-containing protein, partial [Glomus cerebriforme]